MLAQRLPSAMIADVTSLAIAIAWRRVSFSVFAFGISSLLKPA
jgi:hypothetical protein